MKSAAADVLTSLEQEYWPILNITLLERIDFQGQSSLDLVLRPSSSVKARYFGITPYGDCER